MFILIALATMTNLGSYPTHDRCKTAIREIYAQKLDPYNVMEAATKQRVLSIQLKYAAPKEYRCQRV